MCPKGKLYSYTQVRKPDISTFSITKKVSKFWGKNANKTYDPPWKEHIHEKT